MSTSPNAHRSLFPLRPVPYERMMLHDDRPDYPMVCPAEFSFEGRFDRPRFESALAQTLLRHPMLQTTIEHRRGHPHRWVWSPLEPEVHWIGDAEPLDYARGHFLDVGQQIGVRLWVQERNNRTRLLFEMHHACTDAAGGMLFVEDLLTLYAASFPHRSGRRPTLRKLDPNLLLRRGHFEGASGLTLRRVYNDLRDMGEVCRFFGCRPRPMAAGPTGPRLLPSGDAVPERVVNQIFSF
ncbi:MAG: condensation domain-containing protein, partial [Planctomycetota bacterium]